MTKKQIIKWWEQQWKLRSCEVQNMYTDEIAEEKKRFTEDSGIVDAAEQIYEKVAEACNILEQLKRKMDIRSDVKVCNDGWYGGFARIADEWGRSSDSVLNAILKYELKIEPTRVQEYIVGRKVLLERTNKAFESVLNNLSGLPSAKECIKYLQSLGVDVSELDSSAPPVTALMVPVDQSFVVLPKTGKGN